MRTITRWALLPSAGLLTLSMAALPVQAQSALHLIEGEWMSSPEFGCQHPGRITVFDDKIQFEWPRFSNGAVVYTRTMETVIESHGHTIITAVMSTDNSNTQDGQRFRYMLSDDKLLIYNYRTGRDEIHSRCS